jgi:hypothetical protein
MAPMLFDMLIVQYAIVVLVFVLKRGIARGKEVQRSEVLI